MNEPRVILIFKIININKLIKIELLQPLAGELIFMGHQAILQPLAAKIIKIKIH